MLTRAILVAGAAVLLACSSHAATPFGDPDFNLDTAKAAAIKRLGVNATATNGITRLQILNCAQQWVDAKMPYCQCNGPDECCGNCPYCDTHRCDCSGFVSYCWGLPYGYVTWTLPQVSTPISKDDLRPGDIMLWVEDHVAFFMGWTDESKTYYYVTQEPGCGIYPNFAYTDVTVYPMNWEPDNFKPYRYNAVSDISALSYTIAVNEPAYQCARASGYNVVAPRVYTQAHCDSVGMQNIKIALGVGFGFMPVIEPDLYAVVNGSKNASRQMTEAVYCARLSGLPAEQTYWISVRPTPEQGWPSDCHLAGQYLLQMIAALYQWHDTVGLFSSADDWAAIFGQCSQRVSEQVLQAGVTMQQRVEHPQEAELKGALQTPKPIQTEISQRLRAARAQVGDNQVIPWYHYNDGVAGYTNWVPFGPFTKGGMPFAKAYALAMVCNIPSVLNFGLY